MQTRIQHTQRYVTNFGVRFTHVLPKHRPFKVEFLYPLKRQLALSNVARILGGVVIQFHTQIVLTICWLVNGQVKSTANCPCGWTGRQVQKMTAPTYLHPPGLHRLAQQRVDARLPAATRGA